MVRIHLVSVLQPEAAILKFRRAFLRLAGDQTLPYRRM
jgi:hypothetical protein